MYIFSFLPYIRYILQYIYYYILLERERESLLLLALSLSLSKPLFFSFLLAFYPHSLVFFFLANFIFIALLFSSIISFQRFMHTIIYLHTMNVPLSLCIQRSVTRTTGSTPPPPHPQFYISCK